MTSPLVCRAMLFDLDGVLADSTANVERHWATFSRRHGLDPAAVFAVIHGRRAIDSMRDLIPHADIETEMAWLEALESGDTEGIVALPGAADALAALPDTHRAIVTSGTHAVASARLRAAGLPVPSLLITAGDLTRGKPDPEGYRLAAHRLDVSPSDAIVVEDAPAGLAAARAAGMRTIGLTTTYTADRLEPVTLLLSTLAELRITLDRTSNVLTLTRRDDGG